MNAVIQFIPGINEEVVAQVKLTRSRDGSTGTATFNFDQPSIFNKNLSDAGEIKGMFLIDEEGTLITREVSARYLNGKPQTIEAIYIMKNRETWDRFMRFMERYSLSNDLTFTKSNLS
jgi:photosystem II protein|uniref:photosystem II protein W n=1 Tax=Vacuolaria virescens TaxID=44451 RepID=UPI0021144F14|nr:photosystem II protein W [Vacuolaria virescens]UTE94745.1 photosystem II protein W [Vacuolaria virescens]